LTAVISSSTLDSPAGRARGTGRPKSYSCSACRKKPVRAQYDSVSSASGGANEGRTSRACASASSAVSP
jgi:hypothetical protein